MGHVMDDKLIKVGMDKGWTTKEWNIIGPMRGMNKKQKIRGERQWIMMAAINNALGINQKAGESKINYRMGRNNEPRMMYNETIDRARRMN